MPRLAHLMRYAARKDANHSEIEAVFRQMLGDHVTDSSGWGDGAGDLYCSWGAFPGIFVEIKRDAKAEYTPKQIIFNRIHPRAVLRCNSVDDAIRISRKIRSWAEAIALDQILERAEP